mgnify:CR=1 FL=1
MMESVISSPLLYNLALTLIHFLWQGCLIALALKFLLILTPYKNSQLRYLWSTLAMVSSLVVPILTYLIIYQPIGAQGLHHASDIASMMTTTNPANNEDITSYQVFFDTLPYISLIWFSIVSLLACKLVIELYNVNQLPKSGIIAADDKLHERFKQLSAQVNLTKTPQLLVSLKTEIPMAIGWLKPIVLIPASMLVGLSPAQLDMLMLHELAHIRRHDYLVNLMQTLVETLLFFHPATCWISKQMRNEREYCSDDIAVKISGNPLAYAHTLADTATICLKHRHHAIPNMAMAASGGDLKQRVVRLVDQHHCASTDDSGKFLASVLIIFSILLVAVKPYLNTNIIDFTSGRISLFQTASEFIQQKPVHIANLSATSIAQLLLEQDKIKEQATTKLQPLLTGAVADIAINSESNISIDNNETIIVGSNREVTSNVRENDILTKSFQNKKETKATHSKAESLLARSDNKSMTELAFARTDSNNTLSALDNPYSSQLASLADEPAYIEKNSSLAVNNETYKPLVRPSKKAKPKYTIQREKRPVVKLKTPLVKAAEILASPGPRYPSAAKRKGIEIDVKVNFIIDADGFVKDIEFEQRNKIHYFRTTIRTAMSKWRFLPAQKNGQPVESKMTKIFSFSLLK